MAHRAKFTIFASYSRVDERLVRAIIQLYRFADGVSVFFDQESIKPGRQWRFATGEALKNCRTVLVFWCSHAAASQSVREEYEQAITLQKAVVPVLLDATPLVSRLSEYQWIDLRGVLHGSHDSLVSDLKIRDDLFTVPAGSAVAPINTDEADKEQRQHEEVVDEERRRRAEAAENAISLLSQHLGAALDSFATTPSEGSP